MKRWICACAISLFASLLIVPQPARLEAEGAEGSEVLVVYDSLGIGTPNEGNVESLLRLLSVFGVTASLHAMDDEAVRPVDYDSLIVVRNDSELKESYDRLLARLEGYKGRYLHIGADMPEAYAGKLGLATGLAKGEPTQLTIGPIRLAELDGEGDLLPYIIRTAGRTYGRIAWPSTGRETPFGAVEGMIAAVPVFRAGSASELAMAYVLKDWMGIPGEGQSYLLYQDIYPFTDLELLTGTADALYAAGIPFIYSVKPVYANTEYPAMIRYLEALKAAQARNGTIFSDAPNVSQVAGFESDNLAAKTELFLNALGEAGIVPLGTGAYAELYWSASEGIPDEGLIPFDTLVLYPPNRADGLLRSGKPSPRKFHSSMLAVRWSELGPYWEAERRYPLPVDVAFAMEFYSGEQEMEADVQQLRDSWIPFADYKAGSHVTVTGEHRMASKDGSLYIDGEQIVLNRAEETVSSDYVYRDESPRSFELFFTIQNYVYLAVIGLSLLLFGVVLAIGYRLYKRKFMK